MPNALITGGEKGIGLSTVEILQQKGWNATSIRRGQMDVSDLGSVALWTDKLILDGYVPDAIVLCAGRWDSSSEHSLEQYAYHYRMLAGHWMLMSRFLAQLSIRGGCVIAVASTRAFIGGVDTGPYSVAKAALVAMMQGYAREYGKGIRFNVVAPGLTRTSLGEQVVATGGAKEGAPMLEPIDVAQVIVDLIEDKEANGKVVRIVADKDNPPDISEATWQFVKREQ